VATDPITFLIEQHEQMRKLFNAFEQAGEGDTKKRGPIVGQLIEALTVHTYIENEGMYPATRELLPQLEADILESYEEHHVADVLCFELVSMTPDDERFDAKAKVLIENVTLHIEEEEQEWFPKVREGLSEDQLQQIGARLVELSKKAPTMPTEPDAIKKARDAVSA
jgi:hemerythrin-like domain-containing protein